MSLLRKPSRPKEDSRAERAIIAFTEGKNGYILVAKGPLITEEISNLGNNIEENGFQPKGEVDEVWDGLLVVDAVPRTVPVGWEYPGEYDLEFTPQSQRRLNEKELAALAIGDYESILNQWADIKADFEVEE